MRRRVLCLGLILLSGVRDGFGQAPASPPPEFPRVAIISTADTADLASLLTAELSNNPAISLVERDDLAKARDELKLEQLAETDAAALGKQIGADGLIFISKSPDGLQVRFTAMGLGYALFDDRYDAATDLPHMAQTIAVRIADYAPKLKLRPEEAILLSVLNLRADVAATDSSNLERKLTPGSLWGTGMSGKQEPLPPQPEWSQHALWQEPPNEQASETSYGFRGDDLFCFVLHHKTGQKELLWYRQGQPDPTHIPLSFKMGEDAANALNVFDTADDDARKAQRLPDLTPLHMYCAPQGLCFVAASQGFWFLPFADVDNYLNTHSSPGH